MIVLMVVFAGQPSWSQRRPDFSKPAVIDRFRTDLEYLASDELGGRGSGTEDERTAAEYIKTQMQEIGLQPVFGSSYFQEFDFLGSYEWGEDNTVSIGDLIFKHGEDFFTLPGNSNDIISAGVIDVGYGVDWIAGFDDYAGITDTRGKIFLMEYYLSPEMEDSTELNTNQQVERKVATAINKGAAAVLFKNTQTRFNDPRTNMRIGIEDLHFPVLYVKEGVLAALNQHPGKNIQITTSVNRPVLQSLNVAGYIDNQAETTVVVGAHYDHVGYTIQDTDDGSERVIYYGADDNASGTAGVLEAARYFSNSTLTNNNYLFITFGAEERGLVGSRLFTNSNAYDLSRVNYMFNLDMIGRLTDNQLTLIGTGSSPIWDDLIDRKAHESFEVKKNPGGLGGSDHTPFYLKDIPVIFFFTGIHQDYHKPTDTPDKINYEGSYQILSMMFRMAEELDKSDRLAFTRTDAVRRPRGLHGPTFGVMPDHAFEGEGLRVLAVMGDRPAHLAGIKQGDVIIRIDGNEVREMHTYTEALGAMQRGQKAHVVVKRGVEEVTLQVQF